MYRRTPSKGITLLEVVIAFALAMAAMTAIAQTLVTVARQHRLSEQRATALEQAANTLERIQMVPWDELGTAADWKLPEDAPRIGAGERLAVDVDDVERVERGNRQIETRRITVKVEWETGGGSVPEGVRLVGWRHRLAEEFAP